MQYCGVLDVEGTTVSLEQKLNQALHGIYLPHSASQHDMLPTHFCKEVKVQLMLR